MKQFLNNLPIRHKQALLLMITSGLALLLASAAVIVHAHFDFRGKLQRSMDIIAAVMAKDTQAALDFNDAKSAEESLASLQAEPSVLAACVYDRNKQVFATYQQAGMTNNTAFPVMRTAGHEFRDGRLYTFHIMREDRGTLGGVCIISSLDELPEHSKRYTTVVGIVFVVAMLLAFLVASQLQWLISDPVRRLAVVTRAVAAQKNYSLRAQKEGNDEIGQLVDGFNEMLSQIQVRDVELQTARDNLERRVEQRTQDLQQEVERRRLAQEALQESEALYSSLVEQLPMGVFRKDAEGRYVFINSWFCRLKDIRPEDMLGKTPQELAAAEMAEGRPNLPDVTLLAQQGTDDHKLIMETGRQIELEEEYPAVQGKPHYLQVVKLPVFGPDGRTITGSQGIMFDITARKLAEASLQKSHALLTTTIESIADGIIALDLKGEVITFNEKFVSLFGIPQDVAERRGMESIYPVVLGLMKAPALLTERVRQMRANPESEQFDVVELKDGRIFERYARPQMMGSECVGVVLNWRDVTERKRAEAQLAYERDLLKALLDNLPDVIYFKDAESRFVRVSRSKAEKEFKLALDLYHAAHPAEKDAILPVHLRTVEQFTEFMVGKTDADFLPGEAAREFYEEEQEIIRTGKPLIGDLVQAKLLDGNTGWYLRTKMPWRDRDGKIIGTFGASKDVTSLKDAEARLAEASALMTSLLANTPDYIYFKDRQSRFIRCSASMASLFKVDNVDKVMGKADCDFFAEEHARDAYEDEQRIIRTGQPIIGKTEKETWPDGRVSWALTTKMPLRDGSNQIIGTFGISKDITPLKEAEAKLKEVHSDLVQTSRRAGMADVATSVLHNVGNVLNSVNTSAGVIAERLRKSKMSGISRVVAMFEEHEQDFMEFLSQEGRRSQLTNYLKTLAQHLVSEQTALLNEVQDLNSNVEHIKEIVTMQQSYAKVTGVRELQNPSVLMEDALRMHAAALVRHEVRVERQYQKLPEVLLDKHKVLQILINLISNAKYAMTDTPHEMRRLTVGVANGSNRIRFIVTDNGVGIAEDNLTRIFSLGFTTRDNGHGFGLHSGFLSAREMGGELRARSDGPGRGATFTLELPIQPE